MFANKHWNDKANVRYNSTDQFDSDIDQFKISWLQDSKSNFCAKHVSCPSKFRYLIQKRHDLLKIIPTVNWTFSTLNVYWTETGVVTFVLRHTKAIKSDGFSE